MDSPNVVIELFSAICDALSILLDTDFGSVLAGTVVICGVFRIFREISHI